jgi:hypothetical protein
MSSLEEQLEPIPPCSTTVNDTERYTDISCFPLNPIHGPSVAVSLQEVSKVPCSYIKADNSIRMGWRDQVTAWTCKAPFGEPGEPQETIRGSWNISFCNPEGDNKATCISLVELGPKISAYGGSAAELGEDTQGYRMDIWNPSIKHPRAEPFRVTLRPDEGIAAVAEEAGPGPSPWRILSLQCGTLEDGRKVDSVIPEGMSVGQPTIIRHSRHL